MGRKPRDDEQERLEKENRDLKSLNRQLTKRLRKIDRQFRKTMELEEEEQKKAPKREKAKPDCPSCRVGFLIDVKFLDKTFRKCTCGYRTATEKANDGKKTE